MNNGTPSLIGREGGCTGPVGPVMTMERGHACVIFVFAGPSG
ncbi:MAG TPA: hypothetical protein VFO10_05115 [Oligoflexus sp.]|nr:hypothetical protein [Oligoflexus sp.]HET9236605.1 hypothetical protein [Oligoflexus sp.]